MIIYGVKVFNKIMGIFGEEHECENCHMVCKSRVLRTRHWAHIMFIPFIPVKTAYVKICPFCYRQINLSKQEAKELMQRPDNTNQNIQTRFIHHQNNKNGYEVWVFDHRTNTQKCILNSLNRSQINNFKKNMGLKNIVIEEVA